jgi:uncharacterized damage-inducible protein DinB
VTQPTAAGPPLLVKMQLDALDELARVAEAMPEGARDGLVPGLNAAGWTLAHVADQQDQYWNVAGQGIEADPWLAEQRVAFGAPASRPPFAEARAALARVDERCRRYLEAVRRPDFDQVLRSSRARSTEQTLGDLLARSVAHIFAHAGELATIASMSGAPDLGLPGALPRSNPTRKRA